VTSSIAALLVALATCIVFSRGIVQDQHTQRFITIDGLRGYLAFGVYLHHSMIWYFYLKSGRWELPQSSLFTHLGQSSVALFFMITGFLFFSKILNARLKPLDWIRLYVSRVLRLTPLYLVAVLILLSVVAALSGAVLRVQEEELISQIFKWLSFAILGTPNVNGVADTSIIIAGVVWTLRYEWVFYGLLPILALICKVRVGWCYVLLSIVTVLVTLKVGISLIYWLPFVSGAIASILVQFRSVPKLLNGTAGSFLVVGLIWSVVALFATAYGVIQIAILTLVFLIIASGNGVFGILNHRYSRILGELSYGIYLLHGLLLFITFRLVIGFDIAKMFDPIIYWLIIIGLAPVLVFITSVTYKTIERPAMAKTDTVTKWLHAKLGI